MEHRWEITALWTELQAVDADADLSSLITHVIDKFRAKPLRPARAQLAPDVPVRPQRPRVGVPTLDMVEAGAEAQLVFASAWYSVFPGHLGEAAMPCVVGQLPMAYEFKFPSASGIGGRRLLARSNTIRRGMCTFCQKALIDPLDVIGPVCMKNLRRGVAALRVSDEVKAQLRHLLSTNPYQFCVVVEARGLRRQIERSCM